MAAKEYPITFTLGIVDKGSGDFAIASGKIRAQAGALESDVTKRFQASAKTLSSFGSKASLALTAPIVGAGVFAGKAAMEFEQGMANISTIIDTNTESLDKMGEKVIEIGKRTPVGLNDLSDALYDARSAGISASDQFGVLEGAAKLAVAGLGSTKESMDLVTSAINAFGLTGEKQNKVYNDLFMTTNYGKTTVAGLAQGFGGVAATIAASGTELDEYLSMVAALTTTGQPASQAHTQLKAVISGLTRESKETSAVFKQLGAKNLPDLIKRYGGLMPAMRAVADTAGGTSKIFQKLGAKDFQDLAKKSGGVEAAMQKIEGVADKDASAILKLVGSTEALNAVLSLTGSTADAQEQALDAMRTTTEGLDAAFGRQNDTASARMQRAKNAMEAASIVIGDRLVPHVTKLAEKLADAADGFGTLSSMEQDAVIFGAGMTAALGPVLGTLSQGIQLAQVLKATIAGGGALGALTGAALTGGAIVGGGALALYAGYELFDKRTLEQIGGVDPNAGAKLHDKMMEADKAKIEEALLGPGPWAPPSADMPIMWAPKAPAPYAPGGAATNQNTETTAKIKIDLSGLPPGARVSSESNGPTQVDVDTGRSMSQ